MKIKFCGAAGEVTGSKHILSSKNSSIMLDCGLFQGKRGDAYEKNRKLIFDVASLDAVILSHPHIDHIGMLPILVKNGFNGDIILNNITNKIARIMLIDSARLQLEDAKFYNKIHQKDGLRIEPLYKEDDVIDVFKYFKIFERNERFKVGEFYIEFLNAGHVLGSSIIYIEVDDKKILYTGDIGRRKQLLLKKPQFVENIDWLIMETTYGDRNHQDIKNLFEVFSKLILQAYNNKSKIIIPSFSLERTQELIFVFDFLRHDKKLPSIPIYVDSHMSVKITDVFNKNINEVDFNDVFNDYFKKDRDPFGYEYINYISTKEESQMLNNRKGPMIIISASGMCEGGRVLHHIRNSIDDENNILLLVGYQAQNTLGRRLKDGAKKVKIFGLEHDVYFQVSSLDFFSSHADQSDLIEYVDLIKPKKGIFLVHGEEKARNIFKEMLNKNGYNDVFLPSYGEEFEI